MNASIFFRIETGSGTVPARAAANASILLGRGAVQGLSPVSTSEYASNLFGGRGGSGTVPCLAAKNASNRCGAEGRYFNET